VKAIVFNGEIDDDSTEKFLKGIDAIADDEPVIVYLCSNGGELSNVMNIVDYIRRKGQERFTFVIKWECSSAALDILCSISSPYEVAPEALSVLHLPNNTVDLRALNDPFSTACFLRDNIARRTEAFLTDLVVAGVVSDEEICAIRKGHDVTIEGPRVAKYIANLRTFRGHV
jgi:hypothetical protein